MKNAVFWDVTHCDFCKNRRFREMYSFDHHGDRNRRARNFYTANTAPNSPILVTLMMEAIRSSETSVLIRSTQHHILVDGIFFKFLVELPISDRLCGLVVRIPGC
jgi:hypothetical protein